MAAQHQDWSVTEAARLYGVDRWGAGCFGISAAGEATVKVPSPRGSVAVPLPQLMQAARERGYTPPLLLRIENLLDQRLLEINESFATAIASSGYRGAYRGVFPIKVNQQSAVVAEICRCGAPYGHGLEAGSKAELLICLTHLESGGLLICNGYKDRDYIDLGLWANKLGLHCFFVIESPAEVPLIIERSQELQISPLIGLRMKTSAQVGGLWTETSGDRSSFGLSTPQLITVVDQLREAGLLSAVRLLHCHLGSQIPALADILVSLKEAARCYADLASEGVPLEYIDLGGGLAVDYLGQQSGHSHSCDYSLADYAQAITGTLSEVLDIQGIGHPTIVTESGRATVAHSSILLFDILDVMPYEAGSLPADCPPDSPPPLRALFELYSAALANDLGAAYQQALRHRDQLRDDFRQGRLTLRQRALGEDLFLASARAIYQQSSGQEGTIPELDGLEASLADIYYGNFSVFQSLPDCWAIGQMFPVMPLQRLNEYPDRQASISDLTCDCDGKLDRFILGTGESATLPLHRPRLGEDYLLGVFLMGAYQETLGDLHNLFGDTHVLSIRVHEDGGFAITREQTADSTGEILSSLEYNLGLFTDNFRARVEDAVRQGTIEAVERQRILTLFAERLRDNPYFRS